MLPNIDDSPSKDLLLANGWAERAAPARGALRPRLRSRRGRQPRRRPGLRGRARRSCAGAWTRGCGDRRPAARRATWSRRRGAEVNDPDAALAAADQPSRTGGCRPQPCGLVRLWTLDVPDRTLRARRVAGALIAPAPPPTPRSAPACPTIRTALNARSGTGKVRYVNDGDTLVASVPGDGLGGTLRPHPRHAGDGADQRPRRPARGDRHAVDATGGSSSWCGARRTASASPRCSGRAGRAAAGCARSRWAQGPLARRRAHPVSEGHALWWPGGARTPPTSATAS